MVPVFGPLIFLFLFFMFILLIFFVFEFGNTKDDKIAEQNDNKKLQTTLNVEFF